MQKQISINHSPKSFFLKNLVFFCLMAVILAGFPAQVAFSLHDDSSPPPSYKSLEKTAPEAEKSQKKEGFQQDPKWLSEDPIQRFENLFSTEKLEQKIEQVQESIARWPLQKQRIWNNMTGKKGWKGLGEILIVFAFVIIAGWMIEKAVGWKLNKVIKYNIAGYQSSEWQESLSFLILKLICSLIGLTVFALTTLLITTGLYESESPVFLTVRALVMIVLLVRLVSIFADMVLAPRASGIRLLNLECSQAKKMYNWAIVFVLSYAVMFEGLKLFFQFGLEHAIVDLFRPISALILTLILVSFILSNKATIDHLFTTDGEENQISRFRSIVLQVWPTMVMFALFFLWALFSFHILAGNNFLARQLVPAWWILIFFPIIDRVAFAFLRRLKKVRLLQSRTFEERLRKFNRRILFGIRIIMAIIAIVQLFKGLGLNIVAMVKVGVLEHIISTSIKIAILLFIADLFWEVLQSCIERQLPDEPKDYTDLETEGGGTGATRAETLLPLVRFFAATTLLIIVVFSVLDILGVQIMPLIASAGVVGIAIGFGAQKLVQDVISGFFFLLDDAFRQGEYIECADMRGTVERISIRSMRLRHHRGAVQTIPFSEISTISNLSRDWITMKLEIRLPYDTDAEKVRKIVKKLGQEMLKNEEYGSSFILPLKSQGVIRVEESALIFRVKFTAKPGEQWVIRRETYRLVKEALEKEGIYFAHRSVHVLTEDQHEAEKKNHDQVPEEEVINEAAATAAVLAAEAEKYDKMDD